MKGMYARIEDDWMLAETLEVWRAFNTGPCARGEGSSQRNTAGVICEYRCPIKQLRVNIAAQLSN